MGCCWASLAVNTTPNTTGHLNSDISNTTTSNTASSKTANSSGNSQFSASSGAETCPNGQILATPNLRQFTFQELKAATKNFTNDMLLGEGGFGKVYKGIFDEKQRLQSRSDCPSVAAIKKLNSESVQGFEEWQAEINFLGRLSHPNLVILLGYCWEGEEHLLVYELMQRGSLDNYLFGRGSSVQPLPWDLRLKIVIGAARGFAFLHASDDRVIYRDIKAANILLDGSYSVKISDFGLAKFGPSTADSHVTTRVLGTYGYVAPEYFATGHLYMKSDVYSFGVVLVEILTGLRAYDSRRPNGQQILLDWIKPYLSDKRKLRNIMDSRLEGKYPSKAALGTAELALKCIAQEPKNRPSMKDVLDCLEQIQALGERPRDRRTSAVGRRASQQSGGGGRKQPLHHHSSLHSRQEKGSLVAR